jgi:zinc transport system ATP-binding protein
MPLIKCEDAALAYDGKIAASNLNFAVSEGDYLSIVGENGSGKSTLAKGLLKLKSPYKGTVSTGDGLKQNQIGYLPQQSAAQKDFPASAYEVVLSGRLSSRGLSPFYSKADKAIVEENIASLGIGPIRNRCYRELSGGQQQRVLLARALCSSTKLLLLDEPVAGLDPSVTKELYSIIESLNKERGIAIVMVSHDIHAAIKYSSHILHMNNEQLYYGDAEGYINSDIGKAFMGLKEAL